MSRWLALRVYCSNEVVSWPSRTMKLPETSAAAGAASALETSRAGISFARRIERLLIERGTSTPARPPARELRGLWHAGKRRAGLGGRQVLGREVIHHHLLHPGPGVHVGARVRDQLDDHLRYFLGRLGLGKRSGVRSAAQRMEAELGGDHAGRDGRNMDLGPALAQLEPEARGHRVERVLRR